MNLRGKLYRFVMRIAHRFDWHHMPAIHPEGDTQLWCRWCGIRIVTQRAPCNEQSEMRPKYDGGTTPSLSYRPGTGGRW